MFAGFTPDDLRRHQGREIRQEVQASQFVKVNQGPASTTVCASVFPMQTPFYVCQHLCMHAVGSVRVEKAPQGLGNCLTDVAGPSVLHEAIQLFSQLIWALYCQCCHYAPLTRGIYNSEVRISILVFQPFALWHPAHAATTERGPPFHRKPSDSIMEGRAPSCPADDIGRVCDVVVRCRG